MTAGELGDHALAALAVYAYETSRRGFDYDWWTTQCRRLLVYEGECCLDSDQQERRALIEALIDQYVRMVGRRRSGTRRPRESVRASADETCDPERLHALGQSLLDAAMVYWDAFKQHHVGDVICLRDADGLLQVTVSYRTAEPEP